MESERKAADTAMATRDPPGLSNLWEDDMYDDEIEHLSLHKIHPVVVDDDLDDDFLMIADDVEDDASLGLMGDDICEPEEELGVILFRPDPPATPPPEDDDDASIHEVTPEMKKGIVKMDIDDIRLPDLQELREEYQHSCRRMGESIWHAEMTRRWRAHHAKVDKTPCKDKSKDGFGKAGAMEFLSGSRSTLTPDLEASRRKMWALIHSPGVHSP